MQVVSIHKIKISDGKPTISHSAPDVKGNRVRYDDIEYPGGVHIDFQAALDALAVDLATEPELIDIDGTEAEQVKDVFVMHSLSIKDGKGAGVTLSGHKIKSNGGAHNFNTSFIRFSGQPETQYIFLEELIAKIERIQKEAVAYLDGSKRADEAQLNLFDPPKEVTNKAQILPPTSAGKTFKVDGPAGEITLDVDLPNLPANGTIAEIDGKPFERPLMDEFVNDDLPFIEDEKPIVSTSNIDIPGIPKKTATGRRRVAQSAQNPSGIEEN